MELRSFLQNLVHSPYVVLVDYFSGSWSDRLFLSFLIVLIFLTAGLGPAFQDPLITSLVPSLLALYFTLFIAPFVDLSIYYPNPSTYTPHSLLLSDTTNPSLDGVKLLHMWACYR